MLVERLRRVVKRITSQQFPNPKFLPEGSTSTFYLSDEIAFETTARSEDNRWVPPSHIGLTKPALIIRADETITFQKVTAASDTAIFVRFTNGLPQISSDGMSLALFARNTKERRHIASFTLLNDDQKHPQSALLEVGHLNLDDFHLEIEAGAGPRNNPSSDWAAIIELVIGPYHQINLLQARSFKKLRTKNEIKHFAAVYDHVLFQEREAKALGNKTADVSTASAPLQPPPTIDIDAPRPGEHPYSYAMRLLGQSVQTPPPNFSDRLAKLHKASGGRRLKIASLCAGTAQIEAAIFREAGIPVDLTLVDFSDKLLNRARSYMPDYVDTHLLVQDVNELDLETGVYDVVVCVSGIHHAVELERIWRNVKQALVHNGELWLVGEQIGANGNRLLPQDYIVANETFRNLPNKYRKNAHTGHLDAYLPNNDFGEATFEGIRSSEIETTINRFFVPGHVYKRNCFLWRFTNQTYSSNYDLSNPEDVATLKGLVEAEVSHFRNGGTATELHAVYRPMI